MWNHDALKTVSVHHLLPFLDGMKLHYSRITLVLRYWRRSTTAECKDISNNSEDLRIFGYFSDDAPMVADPDFVEKRPKAMTADIHLCRCFKGFRHGCSCQTKGVEFSCFLCICCYIRNGAEPPLRQNLPPAPCRKKFNMDVE